MSDIPAPGAVDMTPEQARQAAIRRQQRRLRLASDKERQKYRRDLITPEGAALQLKIATFMERAGAFVLDFIFQWTIVLAVFFAVALMTEELGYNGWAIGGAIIAVFAFLIRNFWFIYFEMGRKAATPGKRIVGLRVAARDGGALKANAVFARNFMSEIEVGLPLQFLFTISNDVNGLMSLFGFLWAAVFMFFPLFNKDKLRVGDLVAGTWVIHAPKDKLKADITSAVSDERLQAFAFTPEQLDAYGIHELHVLEDVLRTSPPDVRADVAQRIRDKIGWTRQPQEADLAFLEAYYAQLRRRLEQRMLFGDKKVDKYDTR
ncbi:MAG: RDD family protein [Pseudomonadota bacterium]